MPQLANPKQEKYASLLAAGMAQSIAYEAAGYRSNPGGASRLAKDPNVVARVAELRNQVSNIVIESIARPVIEHQISKERVMEKLANMAFVDPGSPEAMQRGLAPKDIRQSLVDLARIAGYIVEKREHRVHNPFEDMTDDELRAIAEGRMDAAPRRPAGALAPRRQD